MWIFMSKKLKSILSIAGSDPMGGAGLQADIRTGVSLGFHVLTVCTALTVQNSRGLFEVNPVEPSLLKSQLDKVVEDCCPDAVKIGMIGSVGNFIEIERFIKNLPLELPIVVDPVLKASANGNNLFQDISIQEISSLYINKIFPWITVATPNQSELKFLLNKRKIDLRSYKKILSELSLNHLIIKGGDSKGKIINDKLLNFYDIKTFSHPKVKCENLHGTGCVYSTLLACFLGMGNNIDDAFIMTNKKMEEIIDRSRQYCLGKSSYGPLNLNNYYYDNYN